MGEQASFEQTYWSGSTLIAPTGSLASFVGKANIFGCPSFSGRDHLHRVLDGAIGDDILQSLEPYGFVELTFSKLEQGRFTRSDGRCERLTTSKLRIRCNSQILSRCSRRSRRTRRNSLYPHQTALVTGLIDAAENNWPSYVASDHYSNCPVLCAYRAYHDAGRLDHVDEDLGSLDPRIRISFNAARDTSIFLRGQWKNRERFPPNKH